MKLLKLKQWFKNNSLNLLTIFLFTPTIISISLLFVQGWYFSLFREWLLVGEQLGIGFITSLVFSILGYKLYAYIKLLNDAR